MGPLNESGASVDWWFLYKVPKLPKNALTASAAGYEYAYYDDVVREISQASTTLDTDHGSLRLTLDALFGAPSATAGWLVYNDERPDTAAKDNGLLGHTKGVIGFDTADNTAFWLLHSWPKYYAADAKAMPTPNYGQTFVCVSLHIDDARRLASQMIDYQQPQVYASQLPASLSPTDPLCQLHQSVQSNFPGGCNTLALTTRGGLPFQVIAKNRLWNKDFWNELVGPTLGADINVETWIRGTIPTTLDSDGVHKVFDIKYITMRPIGMPWSWSETHDHAKWAISHADDWVCVGDINRMVSQEKRGGCAIAFQNANLWTFLNKTDLLEVPTGWTTTDALVAIQSSQLPANSAPRAPTKSYFHDLLQTTAAGHTLDAAALPTPVVAPSLTEASQPVRLPVDLPASATDELSEAASTGFTVVEADTAEPVGQMIQPYAAVIGTVLTSVGSPLRFVAPWGYEFTLGVDANSRYTVRIDCQGMGGTTADLYVAKEPLRPVGMTLDKPFGTSAYGVFPNAALSYRGLGLEERNFQSLDPRVLQSVLSDALGRSEFVSVYGKVFEGSDGYCVQEVCFTGFRNRDGAVAVYSRDKTSGAPLRTWFFFKFGPMSSSLA